MPGVYIKELQRGVRTATGMATPVTAFVGRAKSGPVGEPIIVDNFDDFERLFGHLDPHYPLAYAVRDFFLNGGATAVIVRVYKETGGARSGAVIKLVNLALTAAYPGAWANLVRVRVDYGVSADVAARYGLAASDLFNLTICDTATGTTETFLNLTVKESPRRVDRVLQAESGLLHVDPAQPMPGTELPARHGDPVPGQAIWSVPTLSTGVAGPDDQAQDSAALDRIALEGSAITGTGLYALRNDAMFDLLALSTRAAVLTPDAPIDLCP